MKKEHWIFIVILIFTMVAQYGKGIERGKQIRSPGTDAGYIQLLEAHRITSRIVIDELLLELGKEPVFHTREQLQGEMKEGHKQELLRRENWLDG
jgi:hypothetical protein